MPSQTRACGFVGSFCKLFVFTFAYGAVQTIDEGFKNTGWTPNIAIDNYCNDTKNGDIKAIDVNGHVQETRWTQSIDLFWFTELTLPLNITVTLDEYPDIVFAVRVFDYQGMTYKVGSGPTGENCSASLDYNFPLILSANDPEGSVVYSDRLLSGRL